MKLTISNEKPLRVDGGVAQNDFLLQTIATLLGRPVERPKSTDVSALGTAFLAGIGAGEWDWLVRVEARKNWSIIVHGTNSYSFTYYNFKVISFEGGAGLLRMPVLITDYYTTEYGVLLKMEKRTNFYANTQVTGSL